MRAWLVSLLARWVSGLQSKAKVAQWIAKMLSALLARLDAQKPEPPPRIVVSKEILDDDQQIDAMLRRLTLLAERHNLRFEEVALLWLCVQTYESARKE